VSLIGYSISLQAGLAVIGAPEVITPDDDSLSDGALLFGPRGAAYVFSRPSTLSSWALVEIITSPATVSTLVDSEHEIASNETLDNIDNFGCSVVLFRGGSNSSATLATGADLGGGVGVETGVVYVRELDLPLYFRDNIWGALKVSSEGGKNFDFFSPTSLGVFFGFLCAVVVPSALAAALLIHRYKAATQKVTNNYAKTNMQPTVEEFELNAIHSQTTV
jgi:hypothetical protein